MITPSNPRPDRSATTTSNNAASRRRLLLLGAVALPLAVLGMQQLAVGRSATPAMVVVAPTSDIAPDAARPTETAIFAGGCFWGVQGVFQHVKGVTRVVSGYAGGNAGTAHYEMVGSGLTGHAEAVEITYDPRQVSYGALLQIFFSVAHDPTELNRQGPDTGPQYRSAIFPKDAEQARVAQAYIAQLDAARAYPKSLATKVEADKAFFPAEGYHQDFLERNPRHPYIVINDLPKVDQLRQLFPQRWRATAVLTRTP
ncbi:peptide-methionine (S)-S-oxide reductase MsrA [Mitsuaria sp. 7]|uniref:peptide-methionine (S)-S-oxide reductase MsrA n=1 Tax=Mitsuaria sp. 7 TaxID=1658665 RepID=UPI001E4940A6|nr:peptide-methionine (S)-S-oxide reductase MsrA [Mitsuaria sp. 7]